MYQDNFYLKKESNAFFSRWKKNNESLLIDKNNKFLRDSKKEILETIIKKNNLKNKSVLEIGCFVGDLLYYLKKKYNCRVHGIEPSSKAIKFSKKFFNLSLENSTLLQSKLFNLSKKNFQKYDLIICDDVLSWFDRSSILPALGVLDWMLKPKGEIFIRDFSPSKCFAYENHHWPKKKIYNFKQQNGHKVFFLDSGKYIQKYSRVYFTKKFQKIKIKDKSSSIWSDVILKKIPGFTHPIKKIY